MSRLRISYNAPVVLTFALAAVVAFVAADAAPSLKVWFASHPQLDGAAAYLGFVSHVLGHANWAHLFGNFMLILLLGPILEERYGSFSLFMMIVITAVVTGVINLLVGSNYLVGASGIVFMMILLASTANIKQGEIPLTFLAIAVIYLGGEIWQAIHSNDNVSHMAHLIGGATGGLFGFVLARGKGVDAPALKELGLGGGDAAATAAAKSRSKVRA